MSTLSNRGRDMLVRQQKAAAGVAVTYTRVGGQVLTLTVVPGLTTANSENLPGRVEIAERDYLVAVADLMAAGVETPPAVGDRIAETINGQVCVFEVMPPKNMAEPAWRYSSSWRAFYRLHVKRVS